MIADRRASRGRFMPRSARSAQAVHASDVRCAVAPRASASRHRGCSLSVLSPMSSRGHAKAMSRPRIAGRGLIHAAACTAVRH